MSTRIEYRFSAQLWRSPGLGGWHFVSMPQDLATEIRQNLKWQEEGWGRLAAQAKTGNSVWDTAIWYDTAKATYLLPVKAEIRKAESITLGDQVSITLGV